MRPDDVAPSLSGEDSDGAMLAFAGKQGEPMLPV